MQGNLCILERTYTCCTPRSAGCSMDELFGFVSLSVACPSRRLAFHFLRTMVWIRGTRRVSNVCKCPEQPSSQTRKLTSLENGRQIRLCHPRRKMFVCVPSCFLPPPVKLFSKVISSIFLGREWCPRTSVVTLICGPSPVCLLDVVCVF